MKIRIYEDELWPYYYFANYNSKYCPEVDLTEEEIEKVKSVTESFFEMQELLEEKYQEQEACGEKYTNNQ